jgi:cell division protein DivIC
MSVSRTRKVNNASGGRILVKITIGLVLVFAIASAVAIYFDQERQMLRIQERRTTLASGLDAAKAELAALEELQNIVDTDEYIERIARDKLGMVRPNEIIFND